MSKVWRSQLLSLALSLWLGGCANHVFYPDRDWQQLPADLGYSFSDHFIEAGNGVLLHAWSLPVNRVEFRGVLLFFHGNSHNISHHLHQVLWLVDAGYEVVMAEYRGFGASDGTVSLAHSVDDVAVVVDWFLHRYPNTLPRYLLGQSLGASLSAYVLGSQPALAEGFDAIVLDAGFASYRRIMRDAMQQHWLTALVRYPVSLAMPSRFDPLPVIAGISPTPLLILHSPDDQVVDYFHGQDLYHHAGEPKQLIEYPQAHIRGFKDAELRRQLLEYLASHSGNRPQR